MPQETGCGRTVGSPALADEFQLLGRGDGGKGQGFSRRYLQGTIRHRPEIGTVKTGQQVDVRSPATDARNPSQLRSHAVVVQGGEQRQIEFSTRHGPGQLPQVPVLLSGHSIGPQLLRGGGKKELRQHGAETDTHPAIGRRRRGERHLLLENEQNQTGEPLRALPKGRDPELVHQAGEIGIGRNQPIHSCREGSVGHDSKIGGCS